MPALNIFQLPHTPGLGELLGKGLGAGIEGGVAQYQKLQEEERKYGLAQERKQLVERQKRIDNASKDMPSYLKTHYETLYKNPAALKGIEDNYKKILLANPKISVDEARDQAIQMWSQRSEVAEQEADNMQYRHGIGSYTSEERAKEQYPYGVASAIKQHLGQAAAGLLANLGLAPAEMAGAMSDPVSLTARLMQGKSATPLSESLRQMSGYENLPAEGKRELGYGELAASAIPIERLLGLGAKGLSGLFRGGEQAGRAAEGMAQPTAALAKEAISPAEALQAPTAIKPSLLTPEMQATKLRVDRMAPEERIFQSKAQEALLDKELTAFPKYAEEVAADNAYLENKANKFIGPRALATRAQRMQYAESQLPKVRDAYDKSIARVRAIEDEMAASPAKAKELQPLYAAAKRNLDDSQYLLRQTIHNTRDGENVRVGLDDMRQAAQKKTIDIAEKVASGEEVVLKKADYNPDMIKRAKTLGKKKLSPGLRKGDYNTEIHETYQDIYKQRMGQLDQEIEKLGMERNLANLYKTQRLKQEKDILQKMVNHIDAEAALHRHKMGLRELQARQTLQKRMKALKPAEETEKLATIRTQLKTPEGRVKAIDDVAAQATKKYPLKAEAIAKEKIELNKIVEEGDKIAEEGESIIENILSKGPKSEATKRAVDYARRIRIRIDKLLSNVPILGKTPWGLDVLKGLASGIVDSIIPDLPVFNRIRHGTFSAVLFGRHGIGAVVSLASREGIKLAIREWKVRNVVDAYQNKDPSEGSRLLNKYKKSYGSSIAKEGLERFQGRTKP